VITDLPLRVQPTTVEISGLGSRVPHSPAPQFVPQRWTWIILAVGVLLRLAQYLSNRSLWYDEALLALNVLHRPWGGLLKTLDYNQGAPIGFLLLEKLSTHVLGKSEFALRAVPFLAGVGALFLFWEVAQICVSPKAFPIGLVLFALAASLISYSSEMKQYSSDVTVNLFLLWTLSGSDIPQRTGGLLKVAIVGAVAIWFSHPAAFVLAGAGIGWTLSIVTTRNWGRLRGLLVILLAWALSFGSCYVVSLRALSHTEILLNYWSPYFLQSPPWSLRNLSQALDLVLKLFRDSAGLTNIVGAATFVAGCGALFLTSKRTAALLASPLAVALLASALHKYPLAGKFMLFFVPNLLLLIAEGTVWIGDKTRPFSSMTRTLLLVLLLAQPMLLTGRALLSPRHPDDIKPAIQYIRSNERPGDEWYIYHSAKYQFWYYAELYQLSPNVRIGSDCDRDWDCYATDLNRFVGRPRVWLLFSHILIGDGPDEEQFLVQHLARMGRCLDIYKSSGARAYLYDFRTPAESY
jgi:hypothetical protein